MSPTPNLSRIGGCYPTTGQRAAAGGQSRPWPADRTSTAGPQDIDGRRGAPDAGRPDDEIDASQRLTITVSRYSVGTTIVPSVARLYFAIR
jgi:hypothetical protein